MIDQSSKLNLSNVGWLEISDIITSIGKDY
ncbi:hypothetical protein BN177_520030 [Clostridioides difficile E24]|nr:hypothetical protein BN177_520030 [Clostridioides difficile E24]CCL47475.1 hypothetical protein BN178_760028 [Clostridioides difficile T42]